MNIQDPINRVDMTFNPDKEDNDCKVEVPIVFISPALPDNVVQELAKLFHVAGHALKDGIELPSCYVQLDPLGNHALLDMGGAPDRRAMSMFGAQHAMEHDMIVNIAMGEAWSVPPEVRKELLALEEVPEGFKISDHPAAFECFAVQIETLKGIWCGNIQVSPFTGTINDTDEEDTPGQPRTYMGALELVKVDDIMTAAYPPVLPEHMEAMLDSSSLPEVLKAIARSVVEDKLKERKDRLEAKANQAKAAENTAADAIEKASASAK
jgi:hypothetical protein